MKKIKTQVITSRAITLDQLPPEVLMEIFSHVPNRFNLSLVCSDFYDLVCEIDDFHYRLKIIDVNDDDIKLESILNSRRKFNEIKLQNARNLSREPYQLYLKIFRKFGRTIKKLQIHNSVFSLCKLCQLMDFMPKLEELLLYDTNIADNSEGSLNLKCLRTLSFQMCMRDTPKLILKCIPENVLNKLVIDGCILDQQTLCWIFAQQSNLHELEFDPYFVNSIFLKSFQLHSLTLTSGKHVSSILKHQSLLTTLDISGARLDFEAAATLFRLIHLKKLKIWIDGIEPTHLEQLSSLRQLTELAVDYREYNPNGAVKALININLPQLQKFQLHCGNCAITEEFIASMVQHFPNLSHLNIGEQSIEIIACILVRLKHLKSLIFHCNHQSSEVFDFSVDRIRHENLRELKIVGQSMTFNCSKALLELIYKSLPNLVKLRISDSIVMNDKDIITILKCHQRLTHFSFSNYYSLSNLSLHKKFMKLLKESSPSLKHLLLQGFIVDVDDEILRKIFGQQFASIQNKRWNKLLVMKTSEKWD